MVKLVKVKVSSQINQTNYTGQKLNYNSVTQCRNLYQIQEVFRLANDYVTQHPMITQCNNEKFKLFFLSGHNITKCCNQHTYTLSYQWTKYTEHTQYL